METLLIQRLKKIGFNPFFPIKQNWIKKEKKLTNDTGQFKLNWINDLKGVIAGVD